MSSTVEIRRFVSRDQILADRGLHQVLFDVLEFRIASFIGRSDLTAVSESMDQLADPAPHASESYGRHQGPQWTQ